MLIGASDLEESKLKALKMSPLFLLALHNRIIVLSSQFLGNINGVTKILHTPW